METNMKDRLLEVIRQVVWESGYQDWYRKPLVGFVAADDPRFDDLDQIIGNQMVTPREIKADAQTVIVYFLPYSEMLGKIIHGESCIYQEWSNYYTVTNDLLAKISRVIVGFLAEEGYETMDIPPTNNYDAKTLTAQWSHKSVAVLSGIGSFGLNHLLVTKYGTAGRLNSLITNAVIEPSEYTGHQYCLYYQSGKCKMCLERCPTGAISEHGIDKFRCNAYLDGKCVHELQQGCPMCSSGPCTSRGF